VGLALAGCSSGGGSDLPAPGGDTDLTVRQLDGDRLVRAIPLDDCDQADGACARVVAVLPRLRPEPDEVCTEIYGGPERMLVEGTLDGEPYTAEVTRSNGCQIARYDLLADALKG
jgi:hypothetical protein